MHITVYKMVANEKPLGWHKRLYLTVYGELESKGNPKGRGHVYAFIDLFCHIAETNTVL